MRLSIISLAQKGISVPSRGRPGHIVSDVTREKIRNKKLGKKLGKYDFDLVRREVALEGAQRYLITSRVIPDAIMVEGSNLIALEISSTKSDPTSGTNSLMTADVSKYTLFFTDFPHASQLIHR